MFALYAWYVVLHNGLDGYDVTQIFSGLARATFQERARQRAKARGLTLHPSPQVEAYSRLGHHSIFVID